MPHLSPHLLQDMLKNIPDPNQRKILGDIANGRIVKNVRCLSSACDGRLIGHIYANGRADGSFSEDGQMYLMASRDRLDGFKGFECRCGNDSRIARQETPHLTGNGQPPTREGLASIYQNLQQDQGTYPVINGCQEIDGFLIEEVA